MVRFIEDLADYNNEIKSAGSKLVIVDFTASWCGPCKFIAPIFEKMAAENPNVVFLKVDVDKGDEIAQKCGISAMPTFHFYKNGNKVAELCGADPNKLQALLDEHK